MQKIEIVITNDAGVASVLASTECLDHLPLRPGVSEVLRSPSRVYCTNLQGHEDARRALTVSESMAVSRLCFAVGSNTFAVDPTNTACLAAARAYHEAGGRLKRGEQSAGMLPDGAQHIEKLPDAKEPHGQA